MQYSFLASMDYLRINKPIGSGWEIASPLRITNSASIGKRLINDLFVGMVGTIETKDFLSGKPFAYAIAEYPLDDSSVSTQLNLLDHHLITLQSFCNLLWLVKDNSVNFHLGFIQCPYAKNLAGSRVSSNYRGVIFTNTGGICKEVEFTESELQEALEILRGLFLPSLNEVPLGVTTIGPTAKDDRVSRAFYFLAGGASRLILARKDCFLLHLL
jgi:hypothetical protein